MKHLSIILIVLSLAGCGSMREAGIWVSEEEFRNYDASKEMAETFLLSWSFQSGLIRYGLGTNIDKLPADVVVAMDNLDKWAVKPSEEMTDQMWGGVLISQAKVKGAVAKYIYDRYAPGLFQLLAKIR